MKKGNRKKAEAWWLKYINSLQKGNKNVAMYKAYFKSLSDAKFHTLMERLKDGVEILPYYHSNLNDPVLEVGTLLSVGDTLGIDFFQRLRMTDPITGVRYLTNQRYFIPSILIRRQAQHIQKGKKTAKNIKTSDALTGQPAGKSKSSTITLPEIGVLSSNNHDSVLEELLKVNGGDQMAHAYAERELRLNGTYSLDEVKKLGSRPTSTKTVKAILLAMHLDNNA